MSSDKAAFLGPQSENHEVLERLILEALRDHVYWRRNFHPEDAPAIEESDKLDHLYLETNAKLHKELFAILAALKRGVPFYSLRYLAHFNSDLFIPAIVGYFAAMLYNQNNVVAESAPVTVEKELEFIRSLARMLDLPLMDNPRLSIAPERSSWGHLSSGGTAANIEALWVARNLKFYPLAVGLIAREDQRFSFLNEVTIILPGNVQKQLGNVDAYQLLSLTPTQALQLRRRVFNQLQDEEQKNEFTKELPLLQRIGIMDLASRCSARGLEFNQLKLLLPQSGHYSWPKTADLLGLGTNSLIEIEVDSQFRLSITDLIPKLDYCHEKRYPVLSVISVCGTTEEGAVDPLHEIIELRQNREENLGISFWVHSDAAYGGYFASMLRGTTEEAAQNAQAFQGINALAEVDSVSIDPHKLGYVPYPAGAVLYRDSRIRDHIRFEAPYLDTNDDISRAFLGQWTLEGSRPGAAAISCYLAQHCFPLDLDGHGQILSKCIGATKALNRAFDTLNNDPVHNKEFKIVRLFEPELNVVCYAIASDRYLKSSETLNQMTAKVFSRLTVTGEHHANYYQYVVSKTEYSATKYRKQIKSFLRRCGITDTVAASYSLLTLRSVLMNPLAYQKVEQFDEFARHLCSVASASLPEIQLQQIRDKFVSSPEARRMKVLIVEDEQNERQTLKYYLEMEHNISQALEIITASSIPEASTKFETMAPYAAIIDLKLSADDPLDYTGLELIRQLQVKGFTRNIVYSAFLGEEMVEKALDGLGVRPELRVPKTPGDKSTDSFRMKDSRELLNALISFLD